ncbi:DNA cytosine methyltransferase [Pseudoalteromonas distincta]|uniref:DNA cytosine methyltransferase n=1 Tax=Pseudoalteromonas distincta TaxID=77608 RepID=UPI001192F455|nr:DNA cytosine methyltransferase [Pseudoalteromonas elyakovii]TVU70370.1 DNA cytosine methyltransferase [Pseudoalteromonas elyakovii]
MNGLINTKIGINRGVSRIWFEGHRLKPLFNIGDKLDLIFDEAKKRAMLVVSENGIFTVSKRTRNGSVYPLIEIKTDELIDFFGAVGTKIRIVLKMGVASLELHSHDINSKNMYQRFEESIRNKKITVGSLFSGVGILDSALHDGFKRSNISTLTRYAVEQEKKYLDAMIKNQSYLFDDESFFIESQIELVDLKKPPLVDAIIMGIPCTGVSTSGITKNKLDFAEQHESSGACFFYALNFILKCKPWLIVLENVKNYISTASYAVIKSVLITQGYTLSDAIFTGTDFGSLENRERLCLVATATGIPNVKLSDVKSLKEKPAFLSDILEDIPDGDARWKSYDYLELKQQRDIEQGKGFRRCLLDGSETKVPVIRRLYNKGGSTDPFVKSKDGLLSRKFTKTEHAAIKDIPLSLIDGLSETISHECMGQSVCYPVFEALGKYLGDFFCDLFNDDKQLTI